MKRMDRRNPPNVTLHFMRFTLVWAVAALVAVVARIYSDAIVWSVVTPLVVCLAVTLAFVLYLRRIDGALPYFELGAFTAVITCLYCVYPLVAYTLNHYTYSEASDWRLYWMRDRPGDLGTLAWWYVIYLVCFCVAYAVARGGEPLRLPLRVSRPDGPFIVAAIIILIGTKLFFAVLGVFYDLSASSYTEQYTVWDRLPLLLRQVAVHMKGMSLTLQMMLVIALCCARGRRYRVMLAALLLITCVAHLVRPGARVELFSVLLTAVAVYDLAVRRIAFRWIVAGAAAGFVIMLFLGVIREGTRNPTRSLRQAMVDVTEFEIIFANGADLKYIKDLSGGFLGRPNLYWAGIFAIVPQQILPLQKDTTAGWYVREYYREYADMGGGLAFGVLSEAVMGYGVVEMIWRGLLVGTVFGLLHRHLLRRDVSFAFLMLYITLIVWSYQTVRSGTFAPLILIAYHFVAPLVGIIILSSVLRRGRRVARHFGPPAPAAA